MSPPRLRSAALAAALAALAVAPAAAEIAWQGWSDTIFEVGRRAQRPVLLYLDAPWCGACRRFEETVLSNADVARKVADSFVPVRVDAQKRPDLFRRYGWGEIPSVSFLLPSGFSLHFQDGNELVRAGGASFSAEGFLQYLDLVLGYYPRVVGEMDAFLEARFRGSLRERNTSTGIVDRQLADVTANWILRSQDPIHGGIQGPYRLVEGDAVRSALALSEVGGDEAYARFARRTLDAMMRSPVRDPVSGRFSWRARSTDWTNALPEWRLSTQADMLDLALTGWQTLGQDAYVAAAEAVTDALLRDYYLSDPGAFRAAVYAGTIKTPTWSSKDLKRLLKPAERRLAAACWGVDSGRNAPPQELRSARSVREAAADLGIEAETAAASMSAAAAALRAEQRKRLPILEDDTILSGANAATAHALLRAWAVLGRDDARPAAEAALDYLERYLTFEREGVFHGMEVAPPRVIPAVLLTDQMLVARAWLLHYQVSADPESLQRAETRIDFVRQNLADRRAGGFFDRRVLPEDPGELGIPDRRVEENALAAQVMLELEGVRPGHPAREQARSLLASFADEVGAYGPLGVPMAAAMARSTQTPVRVFVQDAGEAGGSVAEALRRSALGAAGVPWVSVLPVRAGEDEGILRGLGVQAEDSSAAWILDSEGVRGPFRTPGELESALRPERRKP